jgi:hypothetical protein
MATRQKARSGGLILVGVFILLKVINLRPHAGFARLQ